MITHERDERIGDDGSNIVGAPATRRYSVLYSYPTWDRNYRGQRGTVVEARDEAHALQLIRRTCSGAEIVRIKVKGEQAQSKASRLSGGTLAPRSETDRMQHRVSS